MRNYIEILHEVSTRLTNIKEEHQIYQIMKDGVREILPDVYFLISRLQPNDMNFRMIHSFGVDKYISAVKTLLGKDPFEMDFPFNDLSVEKQKFFESRKLYRFPDGLYDLVNGRINKTICNAIEKILSISDVYAISFCIGNNYFGGASFFVPKSTVASKGLNKESILTIESIASQASFAIKRLRDIEALKKKEDELKISQSRFNQLVKQMNDIVWKANGDGTGLVDLNNSFEKIYGFPSIAFVEDPNLWFDIVHPKDKDIVLKASKDLFENGTVEINYRIITRDGKIRWLHDRKSIVFDKNGTPVQMGGIASDITERKLLEEQLKLKDYALDNSPTAIGIADLDGIIDYVNHAYVNLFGYDDRSEIIGKHISEFAPSYNIPGEVLNKLKNGEIYTGNVNPKRKNGTTFDCIISASPIINNQEILFLMAVFTDITRLKELEHELRENEAKLSKLNKQKDKFLSIIAHDLKSPFNGMLGLLSIISNDSNDYNDSERLKMIQSSHYSAQKAYTLLADLLEWAKLNNNRYELAIETVNLHNVVEGNIEIFVNDALAKGISIKNNIELNTKIKVDKNSIQTVVRNLLSNAIKFTSSGGVVEFDIEHFNNDIVFSIKDTGVGMSENTISKLFKLGENVSMSGTNNEEGTGLGLIICNDMVIRNNWKMEVESQPNKGTTFKILIPN